MYNIAMIIEDNELERFLIEATVRNSGFAEKVLSFSLGIGALLYLQSVEDVHEAIPEIIFLDIQMPLVNGFDFLDTYLLFPDEILTRSKIVVISSSLTYEDQIRIQTYPIIWKQLSKPLSEKMLNRINAP